MTKLRLIRFLEPRVGEEMPALVISVHPFGLFVSRGVADRGAGAHLLARRRLLCLR
jgi:hypothetical protein